MEDAIYKRSKYIELILQIIVCLIYEVFVYTAFTEEQPKINQSNTQFDTDLIFFCSILVNSFLI